MTGLGFALEGVELRFAQARVLGPVSLRLEAGEQVALIGPSGAGKTSLLRLLGMQLAPSAGLLRIGGVDAEQLEGGAAREMRRRVGFVYQDHRLVPTLRVLQNVQAGALADVGAWGALRRMLWPSAGEQAQVHALLESLGIGNKLFERCDRLSGGERQRVAIARALHQSPQALLADEPVSSVDTARGRAVLELLIERASAQGLTLCVSLHQLALARGLFDRVIGLRDGAVIHDGPPDAIDDDALFGDVA